MYGRAFRAPNDYELYYQDGGLSQKPAVSLRPETIRTYEAAVERQLNRYTQASVSVYDYRIRDLINETTDPLDNLIVFQNAATVQSRGAEFTIRGRWPGGWGASASQAIQRGIDDASRQFLATAPHHLSHATATLPLPWQHLFAAVEIQRTGARRTLSNEPLAPALLTNVTAHRAWGEHIDLTLSAFNVFNAQYADPTDDDFRQASIPQNGRNWRVMLRWHF
jgi:iron complex outermembrane receptor protein